MSSFEDWRARLSGKALAETQQAVEQHGFVLLEQDLWAEYMRFGEEVRRISVELYEALDAIRKLPRDAPIGEAVRIATWAVRKADEISPRTNL